jgi:hypothetical protein
MVRSWERVGWLGVKLDLVWTFMVCIDDSVWLLKAFVVSPVFPFWWFSEPFLRIFMAEFWRRFFEGFDVGVTHEDLVPLFLVTLPLQTRGKLSNLVVFVGAWVLEDWSRDLWFPMIESVSVQFLWGRGRPWGDPGITKVSLQSVGWIERSGDAKLRADPRFLFFPFCLGRAV